MINNITIITSFILLHIHIYNNNNNKKLEKGGIVQRLEH
jgi:hypothetical protein